MDKDSVNFNPIAEEDDGSCKYEGSIVFWYGQAVAQAIVNDGAISLTYTIDSQIVGSSSANIFWTGAPECGQNSSVTYTKNLNNVKTQSYIYSIRDQRNKVYWTGVLNINANTCVKLQLTL